MLKLSKEGEKEGEKSPAGGKKRRIPIKRAFSSIQSTCVKKQFSNMMLYSSNRNVLKKGRVSTVLELVDSAGSDEDKNSDFADETSNNNFQNIVDSYNKSEIATLEESTTPDIVSKFSKTMMK